MNFKKILAAIASAAVAVSAMAISAGAVTVASKGKTLGSSWSDSVIFDAGLVTGEGNLTIKMKDVKASTRVKICKNTSPWSDVVFTDYASDGTSATFDAQWNTFELSDDVTSLTVHISADDAAALNESGGVIFGIDYTVVSAEFVAGTDLPVKEEKAEEPKEEAAEEADDADEPAEEDTVDDEDVDEADADEAEDAADNGLVKKFEAVTLDPNGTKMLQYDISKLAGTKVEKFTIIGKVSPGEDWVGGGGQVGFNSADGWVQIDYNIGEGMAVADEDGNMIAVVDFTTLDKDTTLDTSDPKNLLQIGWWWGSGDGTLQITDMGINGKSLVNEGAAITTSLGDDAAPAEEEVVAPAETPAAGDVAAATDSSKGSPDTGVADVAVVAGLALAAAGAVIVSKKRK